MKRYFITGTDTDCGKTYVTCRLLDYFKERGQRIVAVKPVATGCLEMDGVLMNDDIAQLQQHNGVEKRSICPWRFKSPVSPHLAAEAAGQLLTIDAIATYCFDPSFQQVDYQLIEGAGGLMAPLNATETWVDFLAYSKVPVILVVGMRLGCLNHALLTALALHHYQIPCLGWIANCLDPNMLAMSANIDTLSAKINEPLLAVIPYGEGISSLSHDLAKALI